MNRECRIVCYIPKNTFSFFIYTLSVVEQVDNSYSQVNVQILNFVFTPATILTLDFHTIFTFKCTYESKVKIS